VSGSGRRQLVYAIGLGIRIPDHLTLEALEALQACARLFSIIPHNTLRSLPTEIVAKVESLEPYYVPGVLRRAAYERQVAVMLEAAAQEGPVGYVTVGNPVFFDSVTEGLGAECKQRGIDFHIVAGVSSIDAILLDLRRDVAPGLQVLEASSLLAFDIEPRTDLPCIIMQPNAFGTSYVVGGRQVSPEAMAVLREYLLRFYRPDHPVMYVTSAVHPSASAEVVRFPLGELGGTADRPQVPGASLFIPAARPLTLNPKFLQRMEDADGFERSFR